MGGLCAILNQHTILVFWNKSALIFRKPALQKIKKFLYTFLNFLPFMKHISKNNLIISHIQRNTRCCSGFIFRKIASTHIGNSAVSEHSFHNIITVCQYLNIKIFPAKGVCFHSSDIKKFILIILYKPGPLQFIKLYPVFS